jgi:hypothetical protein
VLAYKDIVIIIIIILVIIIRGGRSISYYYYFFFQISDRENATVFILVFLFIDYLDVQLVLQSAE